MTQTAATPAPDPIRVMVVDDSFVIRALLARALEDQKDIQVVTTAANGEIALREMDRHQLDVVVLDIEMPVMDGITAIPLILQKDPNVHILIASTLSQKNAEISLRALKAGATDYLAKPSTGSELTSADQFKADLVMKVKEFGLMTRRKRATNPKGLATGVAAAKPETAKAALKLHKDKAYPRPDVLALGSSTGGPQALFNLLGLLKGKIRIPIVLTQHMPPTFTSILAQHIKQQTGFEAFEAQTGMALEGGKVYVAPGDFHMKFRKEGTRILVTLDQSPPVNFCRPAVDVMLRSLMEIYNAKILAVILTGLGQDGKAACTELFEKGGAVLAQDETTSVVWGMPGAVANAGICANVLPLSHLAPEIERMVR